MRAPRNETWKRLTKKERDAIIDALGFVTAGVDPWEHDAPDDDHNSPTFEACWTAWAKLTGRDKP